MKTILGILFAVAMLFSVPSAQAQRGGHSSGHSNGGQRGGSQHTGGSRGSVDEADILADIHAAITT